jgi:hypothetical protein
MESVPVLLPPALGLKVTVIVQFEPADSVPIQLFVSEKSPLAAIAVTVREAGPGFASVTV